MASLSLVLPLTPSLNAYYRSILVKGRIRVLISREGNQYRSSVQSVLLRSLPRGFQTLEAALHAKIDIYMSRRASDGDNRLKGLFDALQHGEVLDNDNQVCVHEIRRFYDPVNPRVEITLSELEDNSANAAYLNAWKKPSKGARTSKE